MKKILLVLFWVFGCGGGVYAYGPQDVTTSGAAVVWPSSSVTLHVEDDLDVSGKSVSTLVDEAIAKWTGVTEASLSVTKSSLGSDVDNTNVCCNIYDSSACPDSSLLTNGKNPVVVDEDGAITVRFFGDGNQYITLGFAAIVNFSQSTAQASKGEAVFNATCLTGVAQSGCGSVSFSDDDFTSFMVHELGHLLGLNHTQVNLTEATNSSTSDDSLITTMYPFFTAGNGANFKTPERDDKVGLAYLYPASNFASTTGKVTGTVSASGSEFQCANVIARNTASGQSRTDAISFVSGSLHSGAATDGTYEIQGLTAGQTYSIEVEPISNQKGAKFIGASGIPPCDGNGSNPSPANKQFTAQTHSTSVTATAGGTTSGINFTVVTTSPDINPSTLLPELVMPPEDLVLVDDEEEMAILDDIEAIEIRSKEAVESCTTPGTVTSSSSSSGCTLIPSD